MSSELILIMVLLLANGVFSGTELAMVTLDSLRLRTNGQYLHAK